MNKIGVQSNIEFCQSQLVKLKVEPTFYQIDYATNFQFCLLFTGLKNTSNICRQGNYIFSQYEICFYILSIPLQFLQYDPKERNINNIENVVLDRTPVLFVK